LKLDDMDPMRLKKISLTQGNPQSPVNIKVDLLNLDVHGLTNFKIKLIE
jgi:hypothetical protein